MFAATALPAAADTVEVTPSWDGAPGTEKVQRILNVTAQAGIVCCVLSVIVGGAAIGIGRLLGSGPAGVRGALMIFGGGGGSLVISFAAKIVVWLIGDSPVKPA
jgi:hypothetical protein